MKTEIIIPSIRITDPNVRKVLEIAEDITSKNQALTLETLYNKAKKKFKISRNGLFSIIQFLINKKILVEGSKFTRENVLLNYKRKKVYEFIVKYGGVHFSDIRKNLARKTESDTESSGQLIWHLELLLKFGYIKRIKVDRYTIFLPIELNNEIGIMSFLLKDNINRKIIALLLDKKSIKNSEIFKIVDEKKELVNLRINNLIIYNLIQFKNDSSEVSVIQNKKEIIKNILENLTKSLYKM